MGKRKRGSNRCQMYTRINKRHKTQNLRYPLNRANSVATKVEERTCNNDPPSPPSSYKIYPAVSWCIILFSLWLVHFTTHRAVIYPADEDFAP